MNKRWIIITSIIYVLMGIACLSAGLVMGRLWQRSIYEREILDNVAKHLGVTSDWSVVRTYVHCGLLTLGMTREEVERELSRVGEYQKYSYGDPYDTYIFQDRFIRSELSDLVLWFDNDILVGKSEAGIGLEPVMISCP